MANAPRTQFRVRLFNIYLSSFVPPAPNTDHNGHAQIHNNLKFFTILCVYLRDDSVMRWCIGGFQKCSLPYSLRVRIFIIRGTLTAWKC